MQEIPPQLPPSLWDILIPYFAALSGALGYAFFVWEKNILRNIAQVFTGTTAAIFLTPAINARLGFTSLEMRGGMGFAVGFLAMTGLKIVLNVVNKDGESYVRLWLNSATGRRQSETRRFDDDINNTKGAEKEIENEKPTD